MHLEWLAYVLHEPNDVLRVNGMNHALFADFKPALHDTAIRTDAGKERLPALTHSETNQLSPARIWHFQIDHRIYLELNIILYDTLMAKRLSLLS